MWRAHDGASARQLGTGSGKGLLDSGREKEWYRRTGQQKKAQSAEKLQDGVARKSQQKGRTFRRSVLLHLGTGTGLAEICACSTQ